MALIGKESPLKGIIKKNHKYLSREWKKNKWQYTYKQPTSKQKKSGSSPIKQTVQNILQKFKIGDRVYGTASTKYNFKELTEKGWRYFYDKGKKEVDKLFGGVSDPSDKAKAMKNLSPGIANNSSKSTAINAKEFARKEKLENMIKNTSFKPGTREFYKKVYNGYDTRTKVTVLDESVSIYPKYYDKNNKLINDKKLSLYNMSFDTTDVKRSNAYTYTADSIDKLPKKKKDLGKEDDIAKCNIFYDPETDSDFATSTTHNCYSCAIAYDMRRRGYDVAANYDVNGERRDTYLSAYEYPIPDENRLNVSKNRGLFSENEVQNVIDTIENQSKSEDSRGIVMIHWVYGGSQGGHAMAYEVNNGELEIYDTQSGEKVDLVDDFVSRGMGIGLDEIEFVRTDNLAITDSVCDYVQFSEPQDRQFKRVSQIFKEK